MRNKNELTNEQQRIITLIVLGGPEADAEATEIMSTWSAQECLEMARVLQHQAMGLRMMTFMEAFKPNPHCNN